MTDLHDRHAAAFAKVEPPAIDAVWRRWEPRFIAAGVDSNIVQGLKSRITSWDDWCIDWSDRAAEVEAAGQEAANRGRTLTAAELWSMASVLYHFGGMYFIADMAQFRESHRRAVETYARAAPLLDPPANRIVAQLDGVDMVGYLRVPATREKPPVVMLFNGFEGSKEESEHRLGELLARGLATVSWDGPGRGETWPEMPMTGSYGPAAAAMIDVLAARDEIDASRIGALGPNRGGFVAAKAAAHDHRIKALAVTSPGYDRRETDWRNPYQEAFFVHLFHLASVDELNDRVMQPDLTLEGDASQIACPTLIIAGDNDQGAQYEGSKRLYSELTGEKEFAVVKGSERNGNNVPYIIRPMMADFLAEKLA